MTLKEYSNLVKAAFDMKFWSYSSYSDEEKTEFNINFSEGEREYARCKVTVRKRGICDMEAEFPFKCQEDCRTELSYILTKYNCLRRYATIRLDLSDGKIVNRYSFDMLPSMTPEFVLGMFMCVKDIDKNIYDTIVKVCDQKSEGKPKDIELSAPTDKKNKFKINL